MKIIEIHRHWARVSLVLLVALVACGEKSESEQLAELRDGVVYTQYRRASEAGLPGGIAAYRKGLEWSGQRPPADFTPADLCAMRVLLAYGALIADKSTGAIAESDIVEAGGCSDFDRLAASSLRAVAFQRMEWPGLAKQESENVWSAPQKPDDKLAPVDHLIVLHIGLGYLAVNEQRWDHAQLHFDALATLMQQPWLSELPRAGAAFHEGRPQEGLITLKRLSRDPGAPEPVRDVLSRWIARIEARVGDVDSVAFMPRLIAAVTWELVEKEGPDALAVTARFVEDRAWKPFNQSLQTGTDKARDLVEAWWAEAHDAVSAEPAKESPQEKR